MKKSKRLITFLALAVMLVNTFGIVASAESKTPDGGWSGTYPDSYIWGYSSKGSGSAGALLKGYIDLARDYGQTRFTATKSGTLSSQVVVTFTNSNFKDETTSNFKSTTGTSLTTKATTPTVQAYYARGSFSYSGSYGTWIAAGERKTRNL